MIDSKKLLSDLQKRVRLLEDDLRARCDSQAEVDAPLRRDYEAAREKGRTGLTYNAWRDEELTQMAVAWVLAGVFVRFLEDNELVEVPRLAGAQPARMQRARDEHDLFFRQQPTANEREYFEQCFAETGELPGMTDFFDRRHNPLWRVDPSADAAADLLGFWRKTDPDSGRIVHDFTDPEWNTRFLGDLYQNLSEVAQKKYALLQTPVFVEEFILDRTLTPAIQTFGYKAVRMIDPACGSGHFLLGGFERLFRIWQAEHPGDNPRVMAQRALDGVFGVDLNPYAVAIARFRLLLAALRTCGIRRLADAPDFKIHLAVGDSLLHGPEPGTVMDRNALKLRIEASVGAYQSEDADTLAEILSQHYQAVVGNPPYITVKDKKLSEAYREMFHSCHRQYSLAVPFMERFFDLAVKGGPAQPLAGPPELALGLPARELQARSQQAGFVGMITANSFMKREFGKKLIERFIPHWNVTHVIDTSGAYIPDHGTPTVILLGRNQPPVALTIRTVMGIKGEPATPEDPGHGLVWTAILDQVDQVGSESAYVSVADLLRGTFYKHPWSIGGGGASELKERLEAAAISRLDTEIDTICSICYTRLDEVYLVATDVLVRANVPFDQQARMVSGDGVRDWSIETASASVFPYDSDLNPIAPSRARELLRLLWPYREDLWRRMELGGDHRQLNRTWWEWNRFLGHRFKNPLSIGYAEIATHNNFVFDRGGKVFTQTSPTIKPASGSPETHALSLTGLLNSSLGCFWLKQACFPKGGAGIGRGIQDEAWEGRYAFDGTKLRQFPLTAEKPLALAQELDRLALELKANAPSAVLARSDFSNLIARLHEACQRWAETLRRMIALQEELDWECYRIYGLIEGNRGREALTFFAGADNEPRHLGCYEGLPALRLGERAFEIVMARKMAVGELQTAWFERHGSTPMTELPAPWPQPYREMVERRIALIESDRNIGLIEQPEYKRRWNTEPWDEKLERAACEWLLNRLEQYFFHGERMAVAASRERATDPSSDASQPTAPSAPDSTGGLPIVATTRDPAKRARGRWVAGQQPALVSTNQLATMVESDRDFLAVAEVYTGDPAFSVARLVRDLVEDESVPFLPFQRYKESGLRKRRDWEQVWELQREEDRITTEKAVFEQRIQDRIRCSLEQNHPAVLEAERTRKKTLSTLDEAYHRRFRPGVEYDPAHPHFADSAFPSTPIELTEHSKVLEAYRLYQAAKHALNEAESSIRRSDEVVQALQAELSKLPPMPEVPVPPKYASADFKSSPFWRLRRKLDVPKERWVSYPGAEREGDDSPVIAWTGWDHLQQAKALAEYYLDAAQNRGWPPEKLHPLLVGLADLLPWVKQWHNEFDPEAGMGFGDHLAGFVYDEARKQGTTIEALVGMRFGGGTRQPSQSTIVAPTVSPTQPIAAGTSTTSTQTPEYASFAEAYPSHRADKLVCAFALEIIAWRENIGSNDHLDTLILASRPDLCRILATEGTPPQLDTWSWPIKTELEALRIQGLKWVQCLTYLEEHRHALSISRNEAGRPISRGASFDAAKNTFPCPQAGLVGFALGVLDSVRQRRSSDEFSVEQAAALKSIDELHAKYALA